MEEQPDNIILFPGWKKRLEEQSLQALKEKKYGEALEKLDQLIAHHEDNQEVFVGKLICLMELGEFVEAQELAEELIGRKNDAYYDYMHIYLTLLFQTNQHDLLIETVDDVLLQKDLPLQMKEQYQQLYAISENMRSDLTDRQSKEDMKQLKEALALNDHGKQWQMINRMRKSRLEPDHSIEALLMKEKIHPVIKTAILLWLKEQKVNRSVEFNKLGFQATVIPEYLPLLECVKLGETVRKIISDKEHENPALHELMIEALERYIYVLYPLEGIERDATCLARALELVASNDEEQPYSKACDEYIEEINTCQALYLTIMET